MPANIPESSQQTAQKFLQQHRFFDYLDSETYLPQLDIQIATRLKLDNPLTLAFASRPNQLPLNKLFLVMDLGGTYLRLYFCKNNGQKNPEVIAKTKISFYQNKIYTIEVFLADLTKVIKEFVDEQGLLEMADFSKTLVFAFANAMKPEIRAGKVDGTILYWGKNHQEKGILGLKLGQALEKHLAKNGLEFSVQAINDSSLSTIAGLNQVNSGDCLAGIVVGTGTNINAGFHHQDKFYLANLEFGDFEFFPYSTFDQELNTRLISPNHFRTEKLFAGAWQSLLMVIMIEFAEKAGLVTAGTINIFSKASAVELESWFNSDHPTSQPDLEVTDWYFCQTIWTAMIKRGAALCALALTRLGLQLKRLGYLRKDLIVIQSGALLEQSIVFRQNFQKSLEENASNNKLNIVHFQAQNLICTAASALLNLVNK